MSTIGSRLCCALLLTTGLLCAVGTATAQISIGGGDRDDTLDTSIRLGRSAFSLAKAMQKITPEDEYYLGRSVAARILSQYPVYEDSVVTHYVNRVGRSLALSSDLPEVFGGYHFVVLDNEEVNAFAAPGAVIFVTRGLLRCTQEEDELAAVLAHEIGHIQRHHGRVLIKEKRWQKFWAVAGSGAVGSVSGKVLSRLTLALGNMAEDFFVSLHTKGYGKKLEKEADLDAVELLRRVGYDPHAVRRMLEAMDRKLGPGRKGFAKTHPKPAARIQNVESTLRRFAKQPAPDVRVARFHQALDIALEE